MTQNLGNTKLLLTGASGFLGSAILDLCRQDNLDIRTVSRTRLDNKSHNQFDLTETDIPDEMFAGVDCVIHAAGLAHQFGKRNQDQSAFMRVNAQATENTIGAAALTGVRHFVLISSSGVYGLADNLRDETAKCEPVGAYAKSKFEGERRAIAVAQETGILLTILRMTTVYGEGDRGNIARLIKAMDRGRFIKIGNCKNRKCLIHKTDAARACLLAASATPTKLIETYNVANTPVGMASVVGILSANLSCPRPVSIPALPVVWTSSVLSAICLRRGPLTRIRNTIQKWVRSDIFDGSKFRSTFAYEPQVDLATGLRRQIQHYRKTSKPGKRVPIVKRLFDLFFATFLILVFAIPMLFIATIIQLTSKGQALYWSDRVGQGNQIFSMAKFRTMRTDAPEVATHLLGNSSEWITPFGRLLRKTSLDELPQLLNVLVGNMSFVGPRPALHNQHELKELRTMLGISRLKPGITGWAAINGRDELLTVEKVEFDRQYLSRRGLRFDLKIMLLTAIAVLRRDGVKQADQTDKLPHIVLKNGQDSTLIATPSTITAVCAASRLLPDRDFRIVCLRAKTSLNTKNILQASRQSKNVVFVTRSNEELTAGFDSTAFQNSLEDWQSVSTIQLPSNFVGDSKSRLAQDVECILEHLTCSAAEQAAVSPVSELRSV